jgi:hypothetical protein
VREEILDRLDVLAGERDQIARAAAHQVGRRQRVELAVEIDAQLGEQAIGDVMRQPAFDPVQDAGERRREPEDDQQPGERRTGFDRGNSQRAEDADTDEKGDPADARGDDDREFARPWPDDARQADERPRRADLRRRGRRRCRGVGAEISRFIVVPGCRQDLVELERYVLAALLGLGAHQPAIRSVAADQLGVPAGLDDTAVVEHQDAVGADDARQPVRQDQGRAALCKPVDRLLDHRLVLGIDR